MANFVTTNYERDFTNYVYMGCNHSNEFILLLLYGSWMGSNVFGRTCNMKNREDKIIEFLKLLDTHECNFTLESSCSCDIKIYPLEEESESK